MKNEYRKMMGQVSLSDSAVNDILEQMEKKGHAKRKMRPLRVAVIAACVCLALVGGAFAAEALIGGSLVEFWQGEMHSFRRGENVPAEGYSMDFTSVKSYPIEAFSEEVRHLEGEIYVEHQSWDEVEAYLGFDLMNNPVLDDPALIPCDNVDMTALGLSEKVHCFTRVDGADGQMYRAIAELRLRTSHQVDDSYYVEVIARVAAEHPLFPGEEGAELLHKTSKRYPEDLGIEFSESTYVAPSGLTATILALHWPSGAVNYHASFVLNGVSFVISASGPTGPDYPVNPENGELGWNFMKEVLDGFVF